MDLVTAHYKLVQHFSFTSYRTEFLGGYCEGMFGVVVRLAPTTFKKAIHTNKGLELCNASFKDLLNVLKTINRHLICL